MTFKEYGEIEERFKNENLGHYIDYDSEWGAQCWDMAEYYLTNYLYVPAWVLADCDLVSSMLYPPKLNDLLQYFDEVDIHNMVKGDLCIWNWGHIAVYDSWDGQDCWFLSQNPVPVSVIPITTDGLRAFRLKGVTEEEPQPTPPAPEPVEEFKVGDYVVPTILLDYEGTPLVQYDDLYQIIEKDDRGNVLGAVRGDERPIWAVLPDSNIKKAN